MNSYVVIVTGTNQMMTVAVKSDSEPEPDGSYLRVGKARFLLKNVVGWIPSEQYGKLLSYPSSTG
jgi:hypothetical protein